ncbi:MAG: J domain-containing protein [Cyanobacteria bacterium J06631_9]
MKLANHYKTLGLRRSASFSDVKTAYRRLVRQYHPDINPDKQAIEQFIEINAAYKALTKALQASAKNKTDFTDGSSSIQSETARRAPSTEVASTPTEKSATEKSTTEKSATETSATAPQTNASEPTTSGRIDLEDLKRTLEKWGLADFQQDVKTPDYRTDESVTSAIPAPAKNATNWPLPQERSHVSSQEASLKEDAYLQLRALLRHQKFPRAIALVEGLANRMPTDSEISQWQAIVYQRWGRHLISEGQLKKAHIYLQKALETDPHNPSLCGEVDQDMRRLASIMQ